MFSPVLVWVWVYLCVHVHVCEYGHAWAMAHVWRSEDNFWMPILASHLLWGRVSYSPLCLPVTCNLPEGSLLSLPPFSSWDSNSGTHAYTASSLSTEPPTNPTLLFFRQKKELGGKERNLLQLATMKQLPAIGHCADCASPAPLSGFRPDWFCKPGGNAIETAALVCLNAESGDNLQNAIGCIGHGGCHLSAGGGHIFRSHGLGSSSFELNWIIF